ncbi:HD domain-containing protein [Modestobacter sp. URMC 112]
MLQPPVDVLRAAEIARSHHRWQTDKAGRPYFDAHVADVHRRLVEESTAVQAVALLHDVLEDTSCTEEELRREFPLHVVDAVVALTTDRASRWSTTTPGCAATRWPAR